MARGAPLDIKSELIEEFRHNGLVTEYLVKVMPAKLWRAEPPSRRGRTIAAIVAHVQSVRRTFAVMGGAQPEPPSLDRKASTQREAQKALRQSTEILSRLFEGALNGGQARVKGMPRRAVNMIAYLIQHDAHHRGQMCTLARDLGHEFASDDIQRIWGWKSLPPMR